MDLKIGQTVWVHRKDRGIHWGFPSQSDIPRIATVESFGVGEKLFLRDENGKEFVSFNSWCFNTEREVYEDIRKCILENIKLYQERLDKLPKFRKIKFEKGNRVHVDTDNTYWEKRIVDNGTILEVYTKSIQVELENFEGGCIVTIPKKDCQLIPH